MSTETAPPPPVETAPGFKAVPESANVKPVDYGAIAEQFQNPEPGKLAGETAKPAVSADDGKPAPKGLAAQIAERNRPKAAELPVKPAEVPPKKTDGAPPPVETLPEDKIRLDDKVSVAARDGFKQLHGITKTLRQQNADREGELARIKVELETARKTPAATDQAEVAKLREEHKKLSDELLVTRLERHPAFQAQYVAPKQQALEAAQELLGEKGKDLESLLAKPRSELGKAVQELTKDLPDLDRLDAAAHIKRAWELEQGGKQAMAQARQTQDGIQAKTGEQHAQIFKNRFAAMAPSAAEHMVRLEAAEGASAEERQSVEAYNSAMQGIEAEAQKIALGTSDPAAVVDHSIKSALYDFHIRHALPRIGAEFEQMQQIIAAQKKEIEGFRSRSPNREFSGAPAGAGGGAPAPKFDSYEQMAEHFASGAHKQA